MGSILKTFGTPWYVTYDLIVNFSDTVPTQQPWWYFQRATSHGHSATRDVATLALTLAPS